MDHGNRRQEIGNEYNNDSSSPHNKNDVYENSNSFRWGYSVKQRTKKLLVK